MPEENIKTMISITMTPTQQQRLLKFLDRVQLTGAEVPSFAQIRNLIASARTVATEPVADESLKFEAAVAGAEIRNKSQL
ncbi:MAG: hypothetical protein ABSE62_16565 [Chthoniobacteraceae bacterium]|jgi:hypothetical protein